MLSLADAELARRDPALPGLATLLDDSAFAAALSAQLPAARIETAKLNYIRYKPHTNCLAAYHLTMPEAEIVVCTIAYPVNAHSKLRKVCQRAHAPSALGPAALALEELGIVVMPFPNDPSLPILPSLADVAARESVLRKLMPERGDLWAGQLHGLRYKPKRRFVAQLSTGRTPQAALKVYTESTYQTALRNAQAFAAQDAVQIAPLIGRDDEARMLAFEWLPGRVLSDLITSPRPDYGAVTRVGAAMARLHMQDPGGLTTVSRDAEATALSAVAAGIADLSPALATRATALARRLAARIRAAPPVARPIHGDFYAQQVLVTDDEVGFLDFDRAHRGDPAADLGNFIAHLQREVLEYRLFEGRAWQTELALLDGYRDTARRDLPTRTRLYAAAGLLRLAPEPFRQHAIDWPARMEAIVARAEILAASLPAARASPTVIRRRKGRAGTASRVAVSDPLGAALDPHMPSVAAALDPAEVRRQFQRHLPQPGGGRTRLRAIRTVRHKPARRCLIEYDLDVERPNAPTEALTLIGKVRAKGLDRAAYGIVAWLWDQGFAADAEDGVSVPEPAGLVPPFRMWLQRKVPGTVATELLTGLEGPALAARIAQAAHKLHRAQASPRRRHTMADELNILRERLQRVAQLRPDWAERLMRLAQACERLGGTAPCTQVCGIHRDFYPDQILVDAGRLYVLDLDLYCEGDPALDIGNFLAHLSEYALRNFGDADALAVQEAAMEERYLMLSGVWRASVQIYKTLTLARHIYISTQFTERRAFTEPLLELCEQRLSRLRTGHAPTLQAAMTPSP
jgi:aminoglycoside phosphotransferase (APT) family kinase protein